MRRIEEYKRLEDDQLQSKGKMPLVSRSRPGIFPLRPSRDLRVQEPEMQMGEVNVAFKEQVHKIVDRIKKESFFRWLNKMGGDPSRRNQNLYCTYHRDKGHTTEQCRVLKDHLGQLVKVGHLKEFVVESGNRGPGPRAQQKGNLVPGDRGHPCRAEGYEYSQDEGLYCGIHRTLSKRPATYKENEKSMRAHCL